jgi:oligopeptidase B
MNIKQPIVKKIPKELTIHNHKRIDNYYWLNERNSPEVIKYLEAENNYLKAIMKHTEPLRKKLYDEITGRIKKEDSSVPYKNNGYFYYWRYEEGKDYPIHCRKKDSLKAAEEILLDVNELAGGHQFCNVVGINVSSDNRILAYGVDVVGRRNYDIFFKNLISNETFSYKISATNGESVWANDNKTLFYTTKDKVTLRTDKVLKHNLGDDSGNDVEIFNEKDEEYSVYVSKTKSDKYLLICSYANIATEYRYLNANEPNGEFKVFQKRKKNHEYVIHHHRNKFYVVTNYNAINFKLAETDEDKTEIENWRDVIPHRYDVLLERITVFNDYLALQERKNGLVELRIINLKNKSEHYIDFPEQTYSAHISVNKEMESQTLRYEYSSLTTPNSIYDYNMESRQKTLLKQEEIIGDFSSDNYEAKRLHATAEDGTKIPISLVYNKKLLKEEDNPLLLYGYGSYGLNCDAGFNSIRLSLLDRGFIYAIAHIRGGQELGRKWYEDGKLLKKKNTFTDFIACAEFLIKKKYTSSNKLFAMGGSAGGLLMGAVSNMAPDLFKGIIAAVPFVDVVTTMLDDSIPLTTGEYDEWGNPNEKKYYHYILSYSPYDNVREKSYPAMLITTGLHDSQVQYWEPAKWTAKLRELKKDNNKILLHTNMSAGHGGASGRFERFKETALEYAFILDQIGIYK